MIIYVCLKNADMTEGRGPMIPDKYFLYKQHAENYINKQPGVMGIRRKWSEEEYGCWRVKEIDVIENNIE